MSDTPYMSETDVRVVYVYRNENDWDYALELRFYDGETKYSVYDASEKWLGQWRPAGYEIEDSDLLELLEMFAPKQVAP
jgi:hypothetical protein